MTVERQEYFSGPLPPPETLAAYEQIDRGLADRIVRMAETEQDRRWRANRVRMRADILSEWGGLLSGFIVAMAFLGAAVYLIAEGRGVEGTILGTVDLVALVGLFVYGRRLTESSDS